MNWPNGERTELALPHGQRLRGFPVIGLTYNNIVRLPDEATLLTKFPDLKVIDVERNPNFDCDSLKEYDRIKIVSDCFKNISEISRVPRIFRPTRECDFSCQAERHYKKLHEYVLNLWQILQQKFKDFDATLRQVQQFFIELVRRVNKFGTDVQVSWKKANEEINDAGEESQTTPVPTEPQATPMPELRPVET
ncbi:hypothetical protein OESDEN_11370 [Oesophagostomum dentatum]|uniref:Uncharacterized protein n=1 Tax=Oesophagostomum dentatum TaxID=61180 RepID=A0A0B1SU31_OESDE|nr:hypothetical protein OESDEN_11370 [Oesophagostomum dentatum]